MVKSEAVVSSADVLIEQASSHDVRYTLPNGFGSDALHVNPLYSYGVCILETRSHVGVGLAFTLGAGNRQLCDLIDALSEPLLGKGIEELMSNFRHTFRQIADHSQYRWLGPHKGLVHLALAAIVNACFDLWAKTRAVPLWKLLLDLTDKQLVALMDLSYIDDELSETTALRILESARPSREARMTILKAGYPAYDTSIGWIGLDDDTVVARTREAREQGFNAFKLKVGSADGDSDVRRAHLLREAAGDDALIMLDANQAWGVERALSMIDQLRGVDPYWIEEPTHPDDVLGHARIAQAIAPTRVATGEHVANRVGFKNLMQAAGMYFVQADVVRLGGVSEFLTVSFLAQKFGLPVVPHVGDMGQIHQHLVLFNHIALGAEPLMLESIPHLRDKFVHPAVVEEGYYATPEEPGSSSDLVELSDT